MVAIHSLGRFVGTERKPGVMKSSSGSDWELVTGALSAHQSFTASSSADAASAADGG